MNPQKIQALIKAAYLEAAEWADDALIDHDFMAEHESVLETFYEDFQEEIESGEYAWPSQWGHDLWLTRQGHGTGFWDRVTAYGQELAERLTNYADELGPCGFEVSR